MSIRITLQDSDVDLIEAVMDRWDRWLAYPAETIDGAHRAAGMFTRKQIKALLAKIAAETAKTSPSTTASETEAQAANQVRKA